MRILYGGSVKPDNAGEILNLPEVGGALVGGASLKAEDFLRIVACAWPGQRLNQPRCLPFLNCGAAFWRINT